MSHTEGSFSGAGGVEIWWQAWLAAEQRANVALSHGLSEHSGRYAHVGAALTKRGYSLWALDHRGHGRSGGARALIDSTENAVEDLDHLVAMASEATPAQPTFLLGHSMGGWLATAYTLRRQERLDGLVLSGPVATVGAATRTQRTASRVLSRIAPRVGVYDVDAAGVSRDPEVVRDYEDDPLNFHGKVPVRTVAEITAEVDRFPAALPAITIPILILYGDADPIVPNAGAKLIADRVSSTDKTVIGYEGLYHEILNELEQDRVIADVCDWLDAHTA